MIEEVEIELNGKILKVLSPCQFTCIEEDFDNGVFNLDKWTQRTGRTDIKIYMLKEYLNNKWRWQNERFNAELKEIEMGLRETTTQTQEDIILARKNAVDEINSLEN